MWPGKQWRRIAGRLGLADSPGSRAGGPPDGRLLVYIGTYTGGGSEGIYSFRFDPATGRAEAPSLTARTPNPTFLAIDPGGRFLYAVNEVGEFEGEAAGSVSGFAIDPRSGRLRQAQRVSSLGAAPTHLSLDRSARFLLVANYHGGNVVVFPLAPDGRLGPPTAVAQDAASPGNPQKPQEARAHFIQTTSDNRFCVVADLGLDQLLLHRFDAKDGSLSPAAEGGAALPQGAGPRHLAFAPSGRFLYVVNELNSTVAVFSFDPDTGATRPVQTLSTLPENFTGPNAAAEIALDAAGRVVYVSNRGHDSIAWFRVDPLSGRLGPGEWIASGGRTPRHLALDPGGAWLLAANQDSNNLSFFRIDQTSGGLIPTGKALKIATPVCVCFAPMS